jgi:N,N'-diacetyllegionaminate synthase
MKNVSIAKRVIGEDTPCFVIAEAGVNHNGDLALARSLIDAAVLARADAVKFQTYRTERLVAANASKADYQKRTTGGGESQAVMLKKLELSFDAFRELAGYCRERGILFLSTPFDEESADFLFELGVPAFKIGSGELTNLPFMQHVALKGLPMIVSTGMADLSDVEAAVLALRRAGNSQIILLHCVSAYPADPATVNLRAMRALARQFNVPVGFSDHTRGVEVAVGAAALGACVLEKHFTLDRRLPGPDHAASLDPRELAEMVNAVRTVQAALGNGIKQPVEAERDVALASRRSLVAARAIRAGAKLAADDVQMRRPGTGLSPSRLCELAGRTVRVDIPSGSQLKLEMFE